MNTIQEIERAVVRLSPAELADFREWFESFDAGAVRAEWAATAERRMADVKAGRVVGIPAEEVLRTLLGSPP